MRNGLLALALLVIANNLRADFIAYQNTTNFVGSAFSNGGAALQGANTITRLVADDISLFNAPGPRTVSEFTFSVTNLNAVTVSARPRIRLYDNDGAGNGPGTLLAAFTFNPIAFGAGSVNTFTTGNLGGSSFLIPDGSFWAGITYDNNNGGTGATAAQLNLLGQGIFSPPTVGNSGDIFFVTGAAGSFVAANPAGSFSNFGGSPSADFGWRFTVTGTAAEVVPVPPTVFAAVAGLGSLGLLRRFRK